MSSTLPTEIQLKIFNSLSLPDILSCREVCLHWRYLLDDYYNEEFWKKTCEQYHSKIIKDFMKPKLPWREIFKSLALWSEVSDTNAKLIATKIKTNKFQLLSNSIISYPQSSSKASSRYYDTIVYFDLDTARVLHRLYLGFVFVYYEENESMIVTVDRDRTIHVIAKANAKQFVVGKFIGPLDGTMPQLILLDKDIYFKHTNCIYNCKLEEHNLYTNVKSENLGIFNKYIISVIHSSSQVNILTAKGYIYSVKDGAIKEIDCINVNTIQRLKEHGFKWFSPRIFRFLSSNYATFPKIFKMISVSAVCSYGNMLLLCTFRRNIIHIYKINEENNTEIEVLLIKSVDLSKSFNLDGKITQINVVETFNGHKIVTLCGDTILIIELLHNVATTKNNDNN